MAVVYTVTISGYYYGFDFVDQRIDIDDEIDRLSVESLYRAIQEAQASTAGIAWDEIAEASGLDTLAEGITTFITVKLLDSWEINTLKVTGKFEVAGGNLIRADGEDPFRDNPLITYINFISQAGVRATFSTGSGLSDEQDAKLNSIPGETRVKELMFNRSNAIINRLITTYTAGGDTNVSVEYDSNGIPTSETVQ